MDEPAIINLTVEKGRDFTYLLELQNDDGTPFDPTGWSVKSEIRSAQDSTSELIAAFGAEFVETLDGATRTRTEIKLSLTDAVTTAVRATEGAYDVMLTSPSGQDDSYIIGTVEFVGRATRK